MEKRVHRLDMNHIWNACFGFQNKYIERPLEIENAT